MHCTNCGIELSDDARFCSGCGNAVTTSSLLPKARDWDLHVRVLGWLVIAHAAMTGLFGLVVMFGGRLLARFIVENPGLFDNNNPNDVPPPELLNLIVPVSFLIGVLILLISMPSIAAGVGLLRYRDWGRVLTLVLSFLRLLEFPFGTVTAVYSFWVLLSQGGKEFYKERAARAEA